MDRIRIIIAALLSPLLVPVLLTMTFRFVYGEEALTNQALQTSIGYAQWLSYFSTLVVGAIVYVVWQKKIWLSWYMYCLAGVIIGFTGWVIFSLVSKTFVTLLFFVFLISGLFAGICFWFIVNFKSGSSTSQRSRRRRRRA